MNATPPEPPYGIIGLGYVGTSLARALSRTRPDARLIVVEPDPRARAQALADRLTTDALEAPGPLLAECRLIFLCVPISQLATLLPQLHPYLAPGVILTDMAPVKGAVDAAVTKALPEVRFVGGHPLIGGRDPHAPSKPDLFVGRPVALCPRPGEESLAAGIATVWAMMGARPVVLPADEHDRIIAATTHAPYLTALALARTAGAAAGAERLTGKSLVDALALAASAPESLGAAVAANPFAPAAIRVLADELRRMADLAEADPEAFLAVAAEGKAAREKLLPDA